MCSRKRKEHEMAPTNIVEHAQLKAGQTVVIHGAAGNVGAYAVQLARRADLRAIATAARDDSFFLRKLAQTQ
jgi:NADPH:quinone reductase-like Zn-dependent oxidoreductase